MDFREISKKNLDPILNYLRFKILMYLKRHVFMSVEENFAINPLMIKMFKTFSDGEVFLEPRFKV